MGFAEDLRTASSQSDTVELLSATIAKALARIEALSERTIEDADAIAAHADRLEQLDRRLEQLDRAMEAGVAATRDLIFGHVERRCAELGRGIDVNRERLGAVERHPHT